MRAGTRSLRPDKCADKCVRSRFRIWCSPVCAFPFFVVWSTRNAVEANVKANQVPFFSIVIIRLTKSQHPGTTATFSYFRSDFRKSIVALCQTFTLTIFGIHSPAILLQINLFVVWGVFSVTIHRGENG